MLQQDTDWQLSEHVPRVLIFDEFRKILTTFLIDKWSFSIDNKVYIREANYNTWTFKFDNFSEFQNVISDTLPLTRERCYDSLHTKIDMWLTPKKLLDSGSKKEFFYYYFRICFLT